MTNRPLHAVSIATLLAGLTAAPAAAHFLELIPSADVLSEGGEVTLDLVFTHPFDGGPVMEMERPAAVGVVVNGAATDLGDRLVETPRDGTMAWQLSHTLVEPGAAVFHVTPQPYWEPAEGKFIVHHTKVVVDSYASGEGWDTMVGLPVEIRPLTRPTGLWTGNVFSGVVTKGGEPVPFAEVEVEFVNESGVEPPNDAFVTQVITADANGTFTYAMPVSGWWGFAALLEGDTPMTSPDGVEVPVEEGALIWVRTTPVDR
jgi:cobalt/nickel transport protein